MDLQPEQKQSILKAIRDKGADGASSKDLHDKAVGFDSDRDISLAVHRLIQQCEIYKRKDRYFLSIDDTALSVAQVSAAPISHVSIVPEVKTADVVPPTSLQETEVEEKEAQVEKPKHSTEARMGKLRRGAKSGLVALVLYRYRNEDYSIPVSRILACLPCPPSNVYEALNRLVADGYAVRFGTGRGTTFKWSGTYSSPFDSAVLPGEGDFIKIVPKSERANSSLEISVVHVGDRKVDGSHKQSSKTLSWEIQSVGEAANNVETVKDTGTKSCIACKTDTGKTCKPIVGAIEAIDAQLDMHRSQIDFLVKLRASVLASQNENCKQVA